MKSTESEHAFRWWNSVMVLQLFAVALTVPHIVDGASIAWGPATDITADSDVVNEGALVYAYDWANAPSTVNGVRFAASYSINGGTNVLAPNFADSGSSYFTSSSTPFSALSGAYRNILVGADYAVASSPYSVPVTLANLTIGRKYLVQVWVNDPRGPENARSETISSPGGNTITLHFSTNSLTNPGGLGQYAVGTFTADATNQTFTLSGNPGEYVTQMNALQVRDIDTQELLVWSGINSGGAGAAQLLFKGPSGTHYTLVTTTNIAAPIANWTPLPNGAGTFGATSITYVDSAATNKSQFYRIRVP